MTRRDATNKVALITGASRGIGAESAVALARAGYDVAITARTLREGERHDHAGSDAPLPGSLDNTARAVTRQGRTALPLRADILDEASILAAAESALEHFGHIDLLLNNAVYQGPGNLERLMDVTGEQLTAIYQGNVLTPLALVKALLPGMQRQKRGTVINMVSYAAFNDPPAPADQGGWGFAYPSSKAALARMAGCLRAEYPTGGLRFYNLEPGTVITEVMKAAGIDEGVLRRYKPCSPAAIAAVVAWLAENTPGDAMATDDVLHGPAIARQLGLLDAPSLLDEAGP